MQNTYPNKGQTNAELNQQNAPQADQPAAATSVEKAATTTEKQAKNAEAKTFAASSAPPPLQTPAGGNPQSMPQNNLLEAQYRGYVPVPREPYVFTPIDLFFGLAIIVLGYFAVRFSLSRFGWSGFKVAIHTFTYAALVLAIAFTKRIKPLKESWYWLLILLANALSYAAWPGGSMVVWRFFLMLCMSLYWPVTVFGGLLENRTSNIFLLDIINIVFVVPLQNLTGLPRIYGQLARKKNNVKTGTSAETEKRSAKRKTLVGVLIGVGISIPLLLMIIPLLVTADSSGGFAQFFRQISKFFRNIFDWLFGERLPITITEILLATPLAFYLCGLLYGFVQKRYIKKIDTKALQKNLASVRILAQSTLVTVLSIVSFLYLVFLASQASYFFSAFSGKLASGYLLHSSYARDGFFELCRLAALNLLIILGANILSKRARSENTILKIFNIVLAATTMLLIFTAFSKMALYISVHGLTIKRVQVCAFLVFLSLVWGAVIALQFFKFSVARFSLAVGFAILCALCVCNIDRVITNYNLGRLQSNTIQKTDKNGAYNYTVGDVLAYNSFEPGDVDALIWMYENDTDEAHREAVAQNLLHILEESLEKKGTASDTFIEIEMRAKNYDKILEILKKQKVYHLLPKVYKNRSAFIERLPAYSQAASKEQKNKRLKFCGALSR